MLMTELLKPDVPRRICERGIRYWKEGTVEIVSRDPSGVDSTVSGTLEYSVSVRWFLGEGQVEATCTCPYFERHLDICKHIWATLLEAQEQRLLPSADFAESFPGSGSSSSDIAWGEAPDSYQMLPDIPDWQNSLESLYKPEPRIDSSQRPWLADRQLFYVLDVGLTEDRDSVVVELRCRDRKKNGDWGKLKSSSLHRETVAHLPDPMDRQLLALLLGAEETSNLSWYAAPLEVSRRFAVPGEILESWVPLAAGTGRFVVFEPSSKEAAANQALTKEVLPLTWDNGEPWKLTLEVSGDSDGYRLNGYLVRGEARRSLSEPVLMTSAGLVFFREHAARLAVGEVFGFIPLLQREGDITIPAEDRHRFLGILLDLPRPPELQLPEALQYEEVAGIPLPQVRIERGDNWLLKSDELEVALSFDYQGRLVPWGDPCRGVYRPEPSRFLLRDRKAEEGAKSRLQELGVREAIDRYGFEQDRLKVKDRHLSRLVRALASEGWHVEAEGQLYREAGPLDLEVTSGIDWFELQGSVSFGDQAVELPTLLRALKHGETSLLLEDGSLGVMPKAWIEKFGSLAKMGELGGQGLHFQRNQIGLLDALLVALPEVRFDDAVAEAHRQLAKFSGLEPKQAPRTFKATLRDYQKEGLGWLHFLREFGFGGCLADDMGLGKTVQVLALLESRRQLRHSKKTPEEERPPMSLIVVPKSLVFNWMNEAQRFAPRVRMMDYTGLKRRQVQHCFGDYDVVITTYGTLRRDVVFLKEQAFDYVVLDEAQAMKNPKSATAKACRLLQARNRLALTGTPIENHLGELMSILGFLNPGLFGPGKGLEVPKGIVDNPFGESGSPNPRVALIAGAIKPFILRRTKAQVAKDLPEKVQQPIYCDLLPRQRKDYDQLREHYQRVLLDKVSLQGLPGVKFQVLEALLRLRQAACHPGLMDPERQGEDGGKLAVLLAQLEEVIDAGHKSLVFSQFTSMLSIVRSRLDDRGVPYEYLDGRTRKREPRIQRFQEDPGCKVFLISLKAGGVGLNLTAAEYVFLLDPWWNPAVEAQAIDRTHRIGQTRTVFAYSLISRDTVEEKVLQLQESKQELADAILRSDKSLIRGLTQEDLAKLLS